MFSRTCPSLLSLAAVCLVAAQLLSCRSSASPEHALRLYIEKEEGRLPRITVANVAQLLDIYVELLQRCSVRRPYLGLDKQRIKVPADIMPSLERANSLITYDIWLLDQEEPGPVNREVPEAFIEHLWRIFPKVENWSHRAVLVAWFELIGHRLSHVEEGQRGSFTLWSKDPVGRARLSQMYHRLWSSIGCAYTRGVMTALFAQVVKDEECLERCEAMLWSENDTEVILGIVGLSCKEGSPRLLRNGRRLLKHPNRWVQLCVANVLLLFGAKEALWSLVDACKTASYPMLPIEDPLAIVLVWGENAVFMPPWEMAHQTLLNWLNLRLRERCPHDHCTVTAWDDPSWKIYQERVDDYAKHLDKVGVLEAWLRENWNAIEASSDWVSLGE